MRSARALATALALAAAWLDCAWAQQADELTRARAHYEAGKALYGAGRYRDAIREFQAGYDLVPRPQFLLNLGQAYRHLGELERARELYRKYLGVAPADEPERPQVQEMLVEIDRELAERRSRLVPAQAQAEQPADTPPAALRLAEAPPAPRPAERRTSRRWWIVGGIGALVAGAAVASYYVLRSSPVSCSDPMLIGCIQVR